MTALTLESLGFTQEQLQERVVASLCKQILTTVGYDYDSDEEMDVESKFAKTIEKRVKAHVDETINRLAEKHVLPNVSTYIEELTLQSTNEWGEKRGQKITFIEYLTERAAAYLQEKVSFDGKAKSDSNGYSWNGTQTRITYMVGNHLHYSIESAMKMAMQSANSAIATGIEETVKVKLEEISKVLKVSAKVGS